MSFDLPEISKRSLRHRGVDPALDDVISFIVACLHDACALVAEDTGGDRYDDRNSKGFLRWRRGRNIIIERVADEGPSGTRAVDIKNSLQIRFGDYALSFYSAREGIASPDLSGSSKAKKALVDEMQLQLDVQGDQPGPTRLAVLYEADGLGLQSVAVGVLANAHEWHWRVTGYKRDDQDQVRPPRSRTPRSPHPSYDEQPVSEKPKLRPKDKRDRDSGDES